MPPEAKDEDEPQLIEGPDPRTWPATDEIWGPVTDLRMIDEVAGLLNGKIAMDGMSAAYEEARRFLRALRAEGCEQLALALLATYSVQPADDAGASPFSEAGKPRAFGADSPPAGKLPAGRAARWRSQGPHANGGEIRAGSLESGPCWGKHRCSGAIPRKVREAPSCQRLPSGNPA